MKQFRRIRSLIDRTVQFTGLLYWNLICSDEEAKQLAVKDQPMKEKK